MAEESRTGNTEEHILDGGTYDVIKNRLQKQKELLQSKLTNLNDDRKTVFGSLETKLIANDRINTENNCIARDIVSFGNTCLFGYNVHFGLRTEITIKDVFSCYQFIDNSFKTSSLDLLDDDTFKTDFTNLYKYYRNTIFSNFAIIGNYLHMVFQLSDSPTDIKTFKWLLVNDTLKYVDNRSEHEYKFPLQQEFKWQEATRDMHRYGEHSHVSIKDRVFVETIGGDLTIKIEDNTAEGKGILDEPVEYVDQTLDDGQYRFGDLGNLLVLEIKPFQESPRYFVYNDKMKEVQKIDTVKNACIVLPDDQGIIFPTGYYLQTGEYHIFDNAIDNVKFQERIISPNGEDFLYVFYSAAEGLYNLMSYNIISQVIKTPIICNGFTILENGELCYFKTEQEQTKHHVVQIWQTPYLKGDYVPSQHEDTLLYKIGNKDIVRAMAEVNSLITLLNKNDNYAGLYSDIAKFSKDILDAYYWLPEPETHQLNEPLQEINKASNAAIDEFEKVVQLRKNAHNQSRLIQQNAEELFSKIKSTSFKSIDEFVALLTRLRSTRGEAISLKEVRYIDLEYLETLEEQIEEQTKKISERCVQFLLNPNALQPYHDALKEKKEFIGTVEKVIEAKKKEEEINKISTDLEMLIDIVSNLDIEDTAHSTKIIDDISLIFSTINELKAALKNKRNSLGISEAKAEFAAQLKLIDQSIINYLDMASTPEKCDEYQTKTSIQLEELEGKFTDFEEFIETIIEKREEVYAAFDARKNTLIEKRNKKSSALTSASNRILKGVQKKAQSFNSAVEINGYFASDLMINKLRDIISQLQELDDSGKAEEIETQLKTAREDALRKLKDKLDLYEDGDSIIRLGKHKFGVNKQQLDLTIVFHDNELNYHLTGTDFYKKLNNEEFVKNRHLWNQEYVSETDDIYRSAYLAYKLFKNASEDEYIPLSEEQLLKVVQEQSRNDYSEGYIKGVHDVDASKILKLLVHKHHELDLLTYRPEIRGYAQFFWNDLPDDIRSELDKSLKAAGEVLQYFPNSNEYSSIIDKLKKNIELFAERTKLFDSLLSTDIAEYLFEELKSDSEFMFSSLAIQLKEEFLKFLKSQQADLKFKKSVEESTNLETKVRLVKQWVGAFLKSKKEVDNLTYRYENEIVSALLFRDESASKIKAVSPNEVIKDLRGSHATIVEGVYSFNYHDFVSRLNLFVLDEVPAFQKFKKTKLEITEQLKNDLKLEEFKPRVLTSFVRNKLIDEVYLPIFGNNLAKQLGTVGANKRTDRMGMLLLISPPGYGKTTLMEYIANRLGLIFVKINGPAIGHEVTNVDPASAKNSAAREELKKLNLAFEMGNNVMLYIDDIQHCNPEFLQKFISLSDGTRKIEGVYENQPKTYDLRGKKFCVIMAGNPYTESGEKFKIPDMLANRADIYNLGDIIGETEHLFRLSLVENSLTANPVLQQLASKEFDDVYTLVDQIESKSDEGQLIGNHSSQEIEEYKKVLEKVLRVRDVLLKVNATYIKSAAMQDEYRVEPTFKLQGSYRDMNKLVSQIVPIMNDNELNTLLRSHYENEAQTLTGSAEANLLKYNELIGNLSIEEDARWTSIKEQFVKNNKIKSFGNANEMAQVLSQMMEFSENLEGIKSVLEKGLNND
ncbi:DNA repair ATPase [Maribacter stanieri]|uniref:DNA repair ATPase n=1 Tax=Maribacter stanieri TaxID=440514 RepID=UPI0030D80021|tara:strand:+ start:4192 stop:9075 length:4884 start_codon:yes stop_codon:yes gene_type:complete